MSVYTIAKASKEEVCPWKATTRALIMRALEQASPLTPAEQALAEAVKLAPPAKAVREAARSLGAMFDSVAVADAQERTRRALGAFLATCSDDERAVIELACEAIGRLGSVKARSVLTDALGAAVKAGGGGSAIQVSESEHTRRLAFISQHRWENLLVTVHTPYPAAARTPAAKTKPRPARKRG